MIRRSLFELAIVCVNNFALVVTNLIVLKLLTNGLDEAIYGKFQLILVACTVVNFIIFGPINASVQRFSAVATDSRTYKEYITAIKLICARNLFVVLVFVCPLLAIYLSIFVDLNAVEVVLSVLYMVLAGQNIIFLGILTGGRNRTRVLVFQLADFLAKLLIVFILRNQLTLLDVLLVFVCCSFFSFLVGYKYHFYGILLVSSSQVVEWKLKIEQYSLPFIKWGLLGWGQSFSEKSFLELNSSLIAVAHLSVLLQVGYQSLVLIDNVITQFSTPILYQVAGSGDSKKNLIKYNALVYKLIYFKVSFYGILAYLMAVNAESIILLLTGPQYLEYIGYLPYFSIAAICFVIGQTATMIIVSQLEVNQLIYPKIVTSIIAIFSNYVLSMYWGLAGMVSSILFFSLIYTGWIIIIANFKVNQIKIHEQYKSNS